MKEVRKKIANNEPLTKEEMANEILDNMPKEAQDIGYTLLKTTYKDQDEILLSDFIYEMNSGLKSDINNS